MMLWSSRKHLMRFRPGDNMRVTLRNQVEVDAATSDGESLHGDDSGRSIAFLRACAFKSKLVFEHRIIQVGNGLRQRQEAMITIGVWE